MRSIAFRSPSATQMAPGDAVANDEAPDIPPFAELLTAHRAASGLTQQELADRASLSMDAVSLLERGARTAPRSDTVARLARAFGLGPAERQVFETAARRRRARTPMLLVPPDLRTPPTAFVGREQELAHVRALLARPDLRLLTLTGPPGADKTRLALEVATALADDYPGGVVVVTLGPLGDAGLVMPAVCQALGLSEAADRSPLEIVVAHCQAHRPLLVLDNFEHLLGAGPELVALLAGCPRQQVLVTSRAPLRVRAEHELPVPPLGLPDTEGERDGGLDALGQVPSVRLFVERAGAAAPGFRLGAENAVAVVAICRRLGGLPLALELAARWIKLLTPQELLERLDRGLELLVDGPRDLPERQRTMRAALSWSRELLDEGSTALLRRLSVFAGGVPLDALERVCQAAGTVPGGVLRQLGVLVDHSLVRRLDVAGGEPRVTMLESVREYGRELLVQAEELDVTARAHLEHYIELAVRARAGMRGGTQAVWLARLRSEHDNVRAALAWATRSGQVERGLHLATALWLFWDYGGHRREGLSWLERLLAAGEPTDAHLRAEALQEAGFLAWQLGAYELSIEHQRESLTVFRELGDVRSASRCSGS